MLNATIAGNIGRDAETRKAGSTTVTGWTVAVEQRSRDGKKTQWVDCSLWGVRGEKVADHIRKGGKICATGELSLREHNGKTYVDLNVSDFTFMGGGKGGDDSGSGSGSNGSDDSRGGSGYGAGGRPGSDMDDSIPFAACIV
jgi:single-strand DNA-binding protein